MCSDDLFVNRENLEKENRSNLEVGPTGAIILAYRFSLSGRPLPGSKVHRIARILPAEA